MFWYGVCGGEGLPIFILVYCSFFQSSEAVLKSDKQKAEDDRAQLKSEIIKFEIRISALQSDNMSLKNRNEALIKEKDKIEDEMTQMGAKMVEFLIKENERLEEEMVQMGIERVEFLSKQNERLEEEKQELDARLQLVEQSSMETSRRIYDKIVEFPGYLEALYRVNIELIYVVIILILIVFVCAVYKYA